MEAESREAVFSSLREKGIKAIKVVAADGSKANGEIVVKGVRKRIVAIAVLATAVIAGAAVYFFALRTPRSALTSAEPLPRQEIKGDRARIESAAQGFESKAELFLARFAEPGRPFSAPECDWPSRADFEAVLKKPVAIAADEFTEQIDMKRMVEGLKRELSDYLRDGGYLSGYIKDLIKRQTMEIDERKKRVEQLGRMLEAAKGSVGGVKPDAQNKAAYEYWVKANAQLKAMGIYPIELPYQLLYHQRTMGE